MASHWNGEYQIGEDLMVFNVSEEKIAIRSGGIHTRPWAVNVVKPASSTPTLNVEDFRKGSIFGSVIKDC